MHEQDDEGDEEWGAYAAACIRELASKKPIISSEGEEKIYRNQTGDEELSYEEKGSLYFPDVEIGWRDTPSGKREEVSYYGGEFGWLSSDELFEERQKYPRTAP